MSDFNPGPPTRGLSAAAWNRSGLGLTISRNLVEAHGGGIRAASTPGRGTTITITQPVRSA